MRDNGIYYVPLSLDLKYKEGVCEMGASILEMYSGVISLRALYVYVNIALLYLIRVFTDHNYYKVSFSLHRSYTFMRSLDYVYSILNIYNLTKLFLKLYSITVYLHLHFKLTK